MPPESQTTTSPGRRWCFTTWDKQPEFFEEIMSYLICQQEKCPTTDKLHWQGFVKLKAPQRFTSLKKLLGEGHFEKTRGTDEDASAYCKKEDTRVSGPFEYGKMVSQGTRTDLQNAITTLTTTNDLSIVAEQHPIAFIKNHQGMKQLQSIRVPKRTWKTEVYWIYGPSGTGKSHTAWEKYNPSSYYIMPEGDGRWWDGYVGQEDVIIDDYKGSIPFSTLLKLLDKYELTVQIKGGHVSFCPRRIFITSTQHYSQFVPVGEEAYQLERRIEHTIYLTQRFDVLEKERTTTA
jgi:hypothetical protein